MAIVLSTRYPGKTNAPSAEYPQGSARNVTVPGDGTGTPWEEALVNDVLGFLQAITLDAGVTPSGDPDTALVSDYLAGLKAITASSAQGDKADNSIQQVSAGWSLNTATGAMVGYNDVDDLLATLNDNIYVVLQPGRHTVANRVLKNDLTNAGIVCPWGRAELYSPVIHNGVDVSQFSFTGGINLHFQNVTFICDVDYIDGITGFGSGHAYTFTATLDSGSIINCGFVLKSSLTTAEQPNPKHSIPFVCLAGDSTSLRQGVYRDSYCASFNTQVASPAITQLTAVHPTGTDRESRYRPIFERWNFIANDSQFDGLLTNERIAGVAQFRDCRATQIAPIMGECGYLNYAEAVRHLPDDYRTYLDEADVKKYTVQRPDGWTQFSSKAYPSDTGVWETVLSFIPDDIRTADQSYQVEIRAAVYSSNLSGERVYFNAIMSNGTLTILQSDVGSASREQLVWENGELRLQFKGNSGNLDCIICGHVKKWDFNRFERDGEAIDPLIYQYNSYLQVYETAIVAPV